MGDRSHITICYLKSQEHLFRKVFRVPEGEFWSDIEEVADGVMHGKMHDINYGGYYELHELFDLGAVFYGHHGAGFEYTESVFACNGTEHVYMPAIDSVPVVRVPEDMKIADSDLEEAELYHRLFREVENRFNQ